MIIGIDTGGTFTDFIVYDGDQVYHHKQLSTPDAPERAILEGLHTLGLDKQPPQTLTIVHGTTVATNAALENKGVRTAYITNTGLKDTLTLARQNRPSLYSLTPQVVAPPVPEHLCFEVNVRRDANGNVLTPLTDETIQSLLRRMQSHEIDAVAINLLFSYLNGDDEDAIKQALPNDVFISCSHNIIPVEREYERGIATWLNSWLSPKVAHYFKRLSQGVGQQDIHIMQSSGGTTDIASAAERAVDLLLSGPAGGLAAAKAIADQTGIQQLLTFDMGGTSTDVALIDGDIALTQEGNIGPYPVAVPMVDMITIGAGGGSLAFVDDGGLLHVGPQSAGAKPGPACYQQGGRQATVTDANVVLQRIPHDTKLGGTMPISAEASITAVSHIAEQLGCDTSEAASGIVAIANEHMTQALRRISIERGHTPADFTLCCFGGAGGLHICDLAEALAITSALVPQYSGLLSALGMVVAPTKATTLKTYLCDIHTLCSEQLVQDANALKTTLTQPPTAGSVHVKQRLTMRFKGQNHALDIPFTDCLATAEADFKQQYQQRYGVIPQKTIEVVHLSLMLQGQSGSLPAAVQESSCDTNAEIIARTALPLNRAVQGPKIITDSYATTYINAGWSVTRDAFGHLRLQRETT